VPRAFSARHHKGRTGFGNEPVHRTGRTPPNRPAAEALPS
jgi:hypothetical protein